MVELDGGEGEVGAGVFGQQVRPAQGRDRVCLRQGGVGVEVVGQDDRAQAGDLSAELLDGGADVEAAAVVVVAVDRDQHGRLDLGEPVEHGAHAEVGRAGGPGSAEAGRGEEGDERVRGVADQRGDPVAGGDAQRRERGARGGDPGAQFAVGQRLGVAVLALEEHGFDVVGLAVADHEGLFGVVEGGAGEPAGAGHDAFGEDGLAALVEAHVEELGDGGPELLELVDGPLPQGRVVSELDAALAGQPVAEARDPGVRDRIGCR